MKMKSTPFVTSDEHPELLVRADMTGIHPFIPFIDGLTIITFDGEDDTYIELASFEAKARGRNILITWETGTEIDNAGFDLYRAEAGDRMTPVKINDRLIPAKGSPAAGALPRSSTRR